VVRTVGGPSSASAGPVPSSPLPVQTALNGTALNGHAIVEDPSGIPSHSTRTYTTADLTDAEFRKVWPQGSPLVMTGLGEKFGIRWRPDHFRDKHVSQTCSIVECQTDASKRVTVGEFFGYFGKYEGRTDHWKLKDWPSSSDFKTALPDLFEEFQKGVPMPNYARRDGVLNIASHFPSNTVMPDLGTWASVLAMFYFRALLMGGFNEKDQSCILHWRRMMKRARKARRDFTWTWLTE
jgi:lysine-specific demethylase 3